MEKAYKLLFNTEESDDLYVYCCGLSQTEAGHSFGPALKPHFMIHFVLSGKGSFTIGGKKYPLTEGYGFLIVPDELAYYVADSKDPWTYVWVGFGGRKAQEIVSQLGLSLQQPVFKSDKSKEIYNLVKDMTEHNTFSIEDALRRNGNLSLFLSNIASGMSVTPRSDSGSDNDYVTRAQAYVRSNYCNPIKVTDIANYVCINRSYLYTLFEKNLGISPHQYLTSYRIAKAVELLHGSLHAGDGTLEVAHDDVGLPEKRINVGGEERLHPRRFYLPAHTSVEQDVAGEDDANSQCYKILHRSPVADCRAER